MARSPDSDLFEVLDRLIGAERFEDAAFVVLTCILETTPEVATRASIHLRPDGDYRGLAALERGAARLSAPSADDTLVPSATAWRWVAHERAPVLVDVRLGRASVADGASTTLATESTKTFDGAASLVRLQSRGATHLLAVPLRAPGGRVAGMVALELRAPHAVDQWPLPESVTAQLELLAGLASPYLCGLPFERQSEAPVDPLLPVVGSAMAPVIDLLRVFARLEESILIQGPTGSGKSRLAAWCHARSERAEGPFVTLDIHTVPEATQMGELFGWRRGAFTGAVEDNPGYIARADGGTLFLDEIDKLSLAAQAALLGLLENKTYRMLGDPAGARTANVRFLVGTNVELADAVRDGKFREDLYYRINVLPVRVLPLDQRRDEVARWAGFMLDRRHRQTAPDGDAELSGEAAAVLERQTWPGNLRQLDNVVRRAYAMFVADRGEVGRDALLAAHHVERALALELAPAQQGSIDALRRAAEAFVDEAMQRAEAGDTLDLDLSQGFRGLVLEAALGRLDERRAVYELFGRDKAIQSRNYIKEIRRELERGRQLVDALRED
ncbi:MAG: sigma 54-interacting transcriptional regulator [Deltaproteobacteria bacterium]